MGIVVLIANFTQVEETCIETYTVFTRARLLGLVRLGSERSQNASGSHDLL